MLCHKYESYVVFNDIIVLPEEEKKPSKYTFTIYIKPVKDTERIIIMKSISFSPFLTPNSYPKKKK